MKKITLAFALLFTLCIATAAMAGWNLGALKTEAHKGMPGGQEMGANQDDMGAFVGITKDGLNYQFTLASGTDPQMPDAETLTYKGNKAFFFEAMPGSGVLMIVLGPDKSLTILCAAGFDSDKEITAGDLTAIADKMDLGAL